MTLLDSVRDLTQPIGDLGGRWMLHPDVLGPAADAGYRNGYMYYVVGRGGVLGDVEAGVVSSAFGFFAPSLIRKMWEEGVEVEGARAAAARYGAACAQFGRTRMAGFAGANRVAELAERVVAGADDAGLALFAGWRAEPLPSDVEARAYFLLHVLRELRGSVHLVAVIASGLQPMHAVLATGGPSNASRFGWQPPFPEVVADHKQMAEELTDRLLVHHYASALSEEELAEFVALCQAAVTHFDAL